MGPTHFRNYYTKYRAFTFQQLSDKKWGPHITATIKLNVVPTHFSNYQIKHGATHYSNNKIKHEGKNYSNYEIWHQL